MALRRVVCLLVALFFLDATHVAAEEWGGIVPGKSTRSDVQERFGPPSRETKKKVEGYETAEWVYEQAKAPAGFTRATVEFGLLTRGGFQPNVVRALTLNPGRGIFTRHHVLVGWGEPDRFGGEKGKDKLVFLYKSGLVVMFEPGDEIAETLLFTVPQTDDLKK